MSDRARKNTTRAAWRRKNRIAIREVVSAVKLANPCPFCDCSVPEALDLHHVDRSQKKFTIANAAAAADASIEEIRKEIDKCIVICANHHRLLHAVEGMLTKNRDLLLKLLNI